MKVPIHSISAELQVMQRTIDQLRDHRNLQLKYTYFVLFIRIRFRDGGHSATGHRAKQFIALLTIALLRIELRSVQTKNRYKTGPFLHITASKTALPDTFWNTFFNKGPNTPSLSAIYLN